MARKTVDVKKIIREYSRNVETRFAVDGVFIFGSHARGEAKPESDIDIIVLSRDFSRLPFMRRLEMLSLLRTGLSRQVSMDILGYTPQEFKKFKTDQSLNAQRIYREAKRIV